MPEAWSGTGIKWFFDAFLLQVPYDGVPGIAQCPIDNNQEGQASVLCSGAVIRGLLLACASPGRSRHMCSLIAFMHARQQLEILFRVLESNRRRACKAVSQMPYGVASMFSTGTVQDILNPVRQSPEGCREGTMTIPATRHEAKRVHRNAVLLASSWCSTTL